MRMKKWLLFVMISIVSLTTTVGCWNYREVDEMDVVGGVAIDKAGDGQYLLSVETIRIEGGRDSTTKSQVFTAKGSTVFDAVRNIISVSGKRLYWSHNKVLIISKDIARDGILPILDWFQRDSETRAHINILLSNESTAREILIGKNSKEEIKSLKLEDMFKNQKSISKAPIVEIWRVINDIATPGIVATLPMVQFQDGKIKIMGTAIFNQDILIGSLNGEQSKYFLFVKDQIKGGLLVLEEEENNTTSKFSLEIFGSKTKVKPLIKGDRIEMNIHVNTTVALDEVDGNDIYTDEETLKELKKSAEKELNKRIEQVILQVQQDYGVDVFGFGSKILENHPKKWKEIQPTWEDRFQELRVNVTSNIDIKGSAMLAEPLEMGD